MPTATGSWSTPARSAKGLVNQGWKDSGDGVSFPDGRQPEPPIALVEVQGYVYDAKLRMADLFAPLRPDRAGRGAGRARRPRSGTRSAGGSGWRRRAPSPWRSTAPSVRCRTVTSNAGHLLWSRVPTPEQAASVARRLLGPELFSGWGIRTLAAGAPGLQPDELSQRLGLAARQRADDPRHGPLRPGPRGAAGDARAARGGDQLAVPAAARAVLRHGPAAGRPAGALSRELFAPGVGVGARSSSFSRPRSASFPRRRRECCTSAIRCSPISSTSSR